jgi:aryl-alcohol dehydrogenase-like predicted oxidoreductase
MRYRKLGSSDLHVSVACLGTHYMVWPSAVACLPSSCPSSPPHSVGSTNLKRRNDDVGNGEHGGGSLCPAGSFPGKRRQLYRSAELYPVPPNADKCGTTEEIIGRWLTARGTRDKVIVATKVMGGGGDNRNFIPANRTVPKNPAAPNSRLTPEQIAAAVEASLRRLQTNYIDLLQLHWPDRVIAAWGRNQFDAAKADAFPAVPFDDQVLAVGELIKAGKGTTHWLVQSVTWH